MKDPAAISERIGKTREGLQEYFHKLYRLRRLVAGDVDALEDAGSQQDPTNDLRREQMSRYGNILNKDFEEGRSNKLLQTIRTLALQVSHKFPEVEFEDLEPEEAAVNVGYLKRVLSAQPVGCGAVQQMQRVLLDYLTGGLGFAWVGIKKGRPIIRAVDTLDMAWDLTAPTIAECRWMSCTVPGSLGDWIDQFGAAPFAKYIGKNRESQADTPIDLEFYYSVEGGEGLYRVLFKTGDEDVDTEAVWTGKNPCFFDIDGEIEPFLPFESMFFMELPSVGQPIGLTEQMLPSQVALWRVEKTIRDLVDLPSFWESEEGAFDDEEYAKFISAEGPGVAIKRKGGKPGMELKSGAVLMQPLLDWRGYHAQEMTAQGGANPYASGAPVEGTTYAAEVNAIQGAAGLMAGAIAKDNDGMWSRVLRKVLAKGAAYDERKIVLHINGVPSEFGPQFPIGPYLKPLAEMVITEDSTQFQPREMRIQAAVRDLDVALKVAAIAPNAPIEAFQDFLKAKGEKNIDKYLKPPATPMMPAAGEESAAPQVEVAA